MTKLGKHRTSRFSIKGFTRWKTIRFHLQSLIFTPTLLQPRPCHCYQSICTNLVPYKEIITKNRSSKPQLKIFFPDLYRVEVKTALTTLFIGTMVSIFVTTATRTNWARTTTRIGKNGSNYSPKRSSRNKPREKAEKFQFLSAHTCTILMKKSLPL